MTAINKQKFLAELGRLLTFMYEEDRQLALSMYGKIFDSCPDAHGLMQILVSPTRQAVVIARAYNAAERKLQVQSVSRDYDEEDDELPEFVLAIDKIYEQAYAKGLMEEDESTSTPVLENQISFFDDNSVPGLFDVEEDAPVEAPAEVHAEEAIEEEPVEEVVLEEDSATEVITEEPEEALPLDEVDAFLASFSIDESQLVPENEAEEEETASEPAELEEFEEAESFEDSVAEDIPVQTEIEIESEDTPNAAADSAQTTRKAKPFLLVLYTLLAVPVTVVGLALLLIPTALVLALAAAVILAGSASFAAAFGGFAVFADVLVILGTAMVISAVGLILLWLFIWFIGGAMAGLVRSVVHLGAKCCYKEVPAV